MSNNMTHKVHKASARCWLLDLFVDGVFYASFRFSSETIAKLSSETIIKEYSKNEIAQK